MNPVRSKTSDYQKTFRQRMTSLGLIRKDAWIRPEYSVLLARVAKAMQKPGTRIHIEEGLDTMEQRIVDAQTLCSVLQEEFKNQSIQVNLMDGVDPVVECTMEEHGSLPIVVALSGEVIIAQATLWPESMVKDTASFNRQVMLSEKLFGLANISLDRLPDGEVYYVAYGALRAQSAPSDIAHEIQELADSVLDIADTFQNQLKR